MAVAANTGKISKNAEIAALEQRYIDSISDLESLPHNVPPIGKTDGKIIPMTRCMFHLIMNFACDIEKKLDSLICLDAIKHPLKFVKLKRRIEIEVKVLNNMKKQLFDPKQYIVYNLDAREVQIMS